MSGRNARLRAVAALACCLATTGLLAPVPVAALAATTPPPGGASPTPDPHTGEPWWVPLGLRGERVTGVSVAVDGTIAVSREGAPPLSSSDGGVTLSPSTSSPGPRPATSATPDDVFGIDAGGHLLHGAPGATPQPDPGAPDLGAGAHLIAAPARTPGGVAGIAVAVSAAGVVWRRESDGTWSRALVLLPRSLVGGRPEITSVTAFERQPKGASVAAVYLGTDGYSALLSSDGGFSWLRAGPGLPNAVLGMASDPVHASVYAATDDGLWVHHLRSLPAPPVYAGADLRWRRLATAGITLGGVALAVLLMVRALPRRREA